MTRLTFESQLNAAFNGLVARVGGYVNQFPAYQRCNIEDINIPDGGYGALADFQFFADWPKLVRSTGRLMKQEVKYLLHGSRIPRDRKTIVMDAHNAQFVPTLQQRYQGLLSSNVLEHSPNPIFLLMNFHYLVKEDGYHFHAIPCYRYTFDNFRQPTPLQHFFDDFINHVGAGDTTHNQEYIDSAIIKNGWQREFHKNYPVAYPYMHFHVFDEETVYQLFQSIFQDVKVELLRTDEFSDVIVFCRNRLNPNFLDRYGDLMREYQNPPKVPGGECLTKYPELT